MDARKSLAVLREEWVNCTKCELGQRRLAYGGEFVFGQGTPGGVMFIGDGPTKEDELHGLPFMSDAGSILRRIVEKVGLQDWYFTTITACRSCTHYTDPATGQPSMRRNFKTKQMEVSYRDDPAAPLQIDACLARLHEQIYLVDPVVIVTIGAGAAKALFGKPMSLVDEDIQGQAFTISIPGAGFRTVRTEKKEAWVRASAGKIQMPVEQSEVRYLCIPTLDLNFVLSKIADQSVKGPFDKFAKAVQKAVLIYERYQLELYGTVPTSRASHQIEQNDIIPEE